MYMASFLLFLIYWKDGSISLDRCQVSELICIISESLVVDALGLDDVPLGNPDEKTEDRTW